jgi:DNA-binding NarL/FixJ family response regulator
MAASAFRRCSFAHQDGRWYLLGGQHGSREEMWKATCFVQNEGGNAVKHETILYIYDHAASSDSMTAELKAKGYEVVGTDSSTQGAAMLYIMHSVAAVVLQYEPEDRTWFELAQSLRAIRPGVPIILLSRDPILYLPSWVDACVGTAQPLEEVASAVHSLLTGERFEAHCAPC